MKRHKVTPSQKTAPAGKFSPREFNKRVSNLLLVCLGGMGRLISPKDVLHDTVKDLTEVVKQGASSDPVTGIAKDIEEYYGRLVSEKQFRETRKDLMKQIVINLTQTLKGMVSTSSDFDREMGEYIEKIQTAETVDDIVAIRKEIVTAINTLRDNSQSLMQEIENYRKTAQTLAHKLEQTEAKALVDELTTVLNRSAYNLKIGQMVREFSRYHDSFALVVVDIDHFKKFNDTYGHKAGDKVLRFVAGTIQTALRATDLVFRYGGEEFVVLLTKVDLENAVKLVDKIRLQVEKNYIMEKNQKLNVTVSLGIALMHKGETELSLFEKADQALYEAKSAGRNCLKVGGCTYTPPLAV